MEKEKQKMRKISNSRNRREEIRGQKATRRKKVKKES